MVGVIDRVDIQVSHAVLVDIRRLVENQFRENDDNQEYHSSQTAASTSITPVDSVYPTSLIANGLGAVPRMRPYRTANFPHFPIDNAQVVEVDFGYTKDQIRHCLRIILSEFCLRKNTTHPKPPPRPPSLPPTLSIQPPSSPTVLEQSQAWVLTAPPTSRTSWSTMLKSSKRNLDTQTTRSDTLFVLSSQSLSLTIISQTLR